MIKIESGIPEPKIKRKPRECPYPLAEMKIGQSFFVAKSAASVQAQIHRLTKEHGGKFRVYKAEQGGEEGVRVFCRLPVGHFAEAAE